MWPKQHPTLDGMSLKSWRKKNKKIGKMFGFSELFYAKLEHICKTFGGSQ